MWQPITTTTLLGLVLTLLLCFEGVVRAGADRSRGRVEGARRSFRPRADRLGRPPVPTALSHPTLDFVADHINAPPMQNTNTWAFHQRRGLAHGRMIRPPYPTKAQVESLLPTQVEFMYFQPQHTATETMLMQLFKDFPMLMAHPPVGPNVLPQFNGLWKWKHTQEPPTGSDHITNHKSKSQIKFKFKFKNTKTQNEQNVELRWKCWKALAVELALACIWHHPKLFVVLETSSILHQHSAFRISVSHQAACNVALRKLAPYCVTFSVSVFLSFFLSFCLSWLLSVSDSDCCEHQASCRKTSTRC